MTPTPIHPKLAEITERIIERSRPTREKASKSKCFRTPFPT